MGSKTIEQWKFRKVGDDNWLESVPGAAATQVHADLLHNKLIAEPFVDQNENDLQWIGETDWEYKAEFNLPIQSKEFKRHEIIFEGLDTFADIFLNGVQIGKVDNMFIGETIDVAENLKFGSVNVVQIRFNSALVIARELEKKKGKFNLWNGELCRLHIRKAPYHFGWDWGPAFLTCGPYKPVHIVSYDSRIERVGLRAQVLNSKDAIAEVDVEVRGTLDVRAKITILGPSGEISAEKEVFPNKDGKISTELHLSQPPLWYPWTVGSPNLHDVQVKLFIGEVQIDEHKEAWGIRKVELIQEKLEDGTSFYFKVNNIPVFAGGSNWIPAHSFSTMLTKEDYRDWLKLAIDGNQNMARVWGGGFYEEDVLYSECDRLGIMVWQDFMFACGQYPGDAAFVETVSKEAEFQLRRIGNHACLTLFAGNNEDYQVAEQCGLEWNPKDIRENYSDTNFPARTIYEHTLPDMMKKWLPQVPYRPGSPWSGDKATFDPTVGDTHQWNVWHGTQERYQTWHLLGSRFISEFGMESLPSIRTYNACVTDKDQLYPQSKVVDHHNKAEGFERRLALYVLENIKVTSFEMESWIYATQFMQLECLTFAYRYWRRNWNTENARNTGGCLVWQLNDCWPVASWAIVDFFKRPKLAYFGIKRELASTVVGMLRNENGKTCTVDLWCSSFKVDSVVAKLVVKVYEATSGEFLNQIYDEEVQISANSTTEVTRFSVENSADLIIQAVLIQDGNVIAETSDWPQPLKYLDLQNRKAEIEVRENEVVLSTDKPIKGISIEVPDDLVLEDNGFDLFPGAPRSVKCLGLKKADEVSVRFYEQ